MAALCRPKAIAQVHFKKIFFLKKQGDLESPPGRTFGDVVSKFVASQEGIGTRRSGALNR
jgi:hypothetical protein